MKPQGYIPEAAPQIKRELADADTLLIVKIGFILIAVLILSLLVLAWLFGYFHRIYPDRSSEASPRVTFSDLPPTPRLQAAPAHDLEEVQAAEDRHIAHYAWVNREQGIAQIPIERAMSIWAARFGPTAATAPSFPATNAAPTELQMRQEKAQEASHAP